MQLVFFFCNLLFLSTAFSTPLPARSVLCQSKEGSGACGKKESCTTGKLSTALHLFHANHFYQASLLTKHAKIPMIQDAALKRSVELSPAYVSTGLGTHAKTADLWLETAQDLQMSNAVLQKQSHVRMVSYSRFRPQPTIEERHTL